MTRFGRFAAVGIIGWALQLVILAALMWMGLHYAMATVIAVEATIFHNFAWHELYTWRDDRAPSAPALVRRLLRFNASTVVVSVVGNIIVTTLAVEILRMPVLIANTAAVLFLSVFNYTAARSWVFVPMESHLGRRG